MKQAILFFVSFFFNMDAICGTEIRILSQWPEQPFLIYVPESIRLHPAAHVPVLFSLHGYRSNAEEQQLNSCANGKASSPTCLDRLADRENFIVVYPNGGKFGFGCRLPGRECFPRLWRPTGGCAVSGESDSAKLTSPSRDNAYLAAVLANIEGSFVVDTEAIYFSGISNGAAMAFDVSCQLKAKVAAVALIAGTGKLTETCPCLHGARPNILQFHGTADPVWPYAGSKKFIQDLARSADCASSELVLDFPDVNPGDNTSVVEHSFKNCLGKNLVHYEIIGGGHTWPGGFLYSDDAGRVTRDINANEVIWNYCSASRLIASGSRFQ